MTANPTPDNLEKRMQDTFAVALTYARDGAPITAANRLESLARDLRRSAGDRFASLQVDAFAFATEVGAEIIRAREIHPGRESTTIALLEEAGELAKALLDENSPSIHKEAVQLAAMAGRIALEGDAGADRYRAAKGLPPHGIPTAPVTEDAA